MGIKLYPNRYSQYLINNKCIKTYPRTRDKSLSGCNYCIINVDKILIVCNKNRRKVYPQKSIKLNILIHK